MERYGYLHPSADIGLGYSKHFENDDLRRRQRNQEIFDKIQELRLKSAMDSARSETFRQLQNEHKALVQKYSNQRNAWHRPVQPTTSRTYVVSTGVNTDLSGPVEPIRFRRENSNLGNEFTRFENEDTPIHTTQRRDPIAPHWNQTQVNPTETNPPFPATSQKIEQRKPTSRFVNLFSSDSDITVTETETAEKEDKANAERRRMSLFLTPTAAAIQKLLTADDTSETTGSISVTPRRTSIGPIPISKHSELLERRVEPQQIQKVTTIDKHEKKVPANIPIENEDFGESVGANTSVGDSVMDSVQQELLAAPQTPDSSSVSKQENVEKEILEGNKDAEIKRSEILAASTTPTSSPSEEEENETDDLSYSNAEYRNDPIEENKVSNVVKTDFETKELPSSAAPEGEPAPLQKDAECKLQQAAPVAASQQHIKLQLAYDDDTESDNSQLQFSKSVKNKVSVGAEKDKEKVKSDETENEDDLDAFFD